MFPKSLKGQVLTLFLLSLIVRCLFIPMITKLNLMGDEYYYWYFTYKIQTLFSSPHNTFSSDDLKLFLMHPPGWYGILTLIKSTVGSLLLTRIALLIISSLSPVILYMLGREAFGSKTGWIAGLFWVFYPNHVFYSHYLWPAIFFEMLTMGALFLLIRYFNNQENLTNLYLAFSIIGLSFFIKEMSLFIFIAAFATFCIFAKKRPARGLLGVLAISLLPIIIYSTLISLRMGHPVFISNASKIAMSQAVLIDQSDRHNKTIEVDALLHSGFQEGTRESHAVILKRILGRKISLAIDNGFDQISKFLSPTSFPQLRLHSDRRLLNYSKIYPKPALYPFVLSYLLLVIMGLIGLCLTPHTTFKTLGFMIIVLFVMTGFFVGFYHSRYRLPIMFLFAIGSAHCLKDFKVLLRNSSNMNISSLLLSVAFFLIIIIQEWGRIGMHR